MGINGALMRLKAMFLMRKTVWELKEGVDDKTVRFAYYRKLSNMGSYIGADATFKTIPVFPHGITGIFISGGASIGANCTIYQHVTIGANEIPGSKRKGYPQIGDNVFIGANAVIIGSVKIGNNVRIGAGATVAIDIPDHSVVVCQSPRILSKD